MVPMQDESGQGVAIPSAGFLNAEARRSLDSVTFAANSVRSVQMPRDTVVKRMLCRLVATFDVTYSSGSPTTSELGVFALLCPQIEVNVNGSRIIKTLDPHLARLSHMIKAGKLPRRAYETSASAFAVTRASREWPAGTLAYPATTQFFLFNETVPISFELDLAYGGNRFDTELDIRDVASADLKFYFGALDIQRTGVGATVTYGNSTISVETQIIENRARPRPKAGDVLFDYVESLIRKSYTGQAQGNQVELQTGNFIAALGVFCRNGGTNRPAQENLLTRLALKINGATAIQGPVSHQGLQDDNQARYGLDDDLGFAGYIGTIASSADAHPLRGFAMINLIRNGDWNTAINSSRQSGVDTCKLEFDTPSSSGTDAATYTTNSLEVSVHTHEIRPYAYNK